MGLTIYYSGRFKENELLKNMIEEVVDVASSHDWKFHIFKEEFESEILNNESESYNIYGISYFPPGSEPIELLFDSSRRLLSLLNVDAECNSAVDKNKYYTNFSKTQYAGMEAHKIIIDLFRYLSAKYFSQFNLIDESYYWETEDENILKSNFEKYGKLMNDFANMLEDISNPK